MKALLLVILTTFFCLIYTNSFSQNALRFDGVDDLVQTTYQGVQGANNRTFEAWIKVEPGAPASNLCILDYGLNAVGSRNTFAVNGSRGLTFLSGGTNANIGSSTNVITEGVWTHVAFVLDNGVGFLYVNGVQVGTGSLSAVNTPAGNQNLIIGQRVTGGSIPFQGSIDEIRIWNVARTAVEIQADTARELCLGPIGLEAYYKFNQGIAGGTNTGLTTLNEEVSSNNGTLSGFALSGITSNWVLGKSLTPADLIQASDTVSACGSYNSYSGNTTWTTSGNYLDTIPSALGCDTLVNINLTILNNSTSSLSLWSCDSITSPSGNFVYYSTGFYTDTLTNAIGCDSIITLNITIGPLNDSISVNGPVLTVAQAGANYQWYLCQAGLNPISGANSQSFTATASGNYAVIVELNGCMDTSDCVLVIIDGIEDKNLDLLNIYPTLTNGEISIEGSFEGKLSIINLKGVKVFENETIINSKGTFSIPTTIQNGMYFVQFQNDKVILRKKIFVFRE